MNFTRMLQIRNFGLPYTIVRIVGLILFIWIAHINVPPIQTGSCSIDFLPVLCFEALVVLTFFKLKVLF